MSLINDLLCDLEARKAQPSTAAGFADLRPVQRIPESHRHWLALPAGVLLLAGSAGAYWFKDSSTVPVAAVNPPATFAVPDANTAAAPTAPVKTHNATTLLDFSLSLSRLPARRARPAPVQPMAAAAGGAAPATVAASAPPATPQPKAQPVQPSPLSVRPAAIVDHRTQATAALSEGRAGMAETHFRSALADSPADTQSWLGLASALKQQGKSGAAEASLSRALSQASNPAPPAQVLARDLLERGATEEALKILKAYRPDSPLDPVHDAFLAAVLQRLGQHDEAADYYRSILAVRPEAGAWWVGLAISEEALGLAESAAEAYRHARNIGQLDTALDRYARQRIAAIQGNDTL